MAFFKFRKGDDDRMAAAAQPESVEVLRKRARHRLIGAAVLVLVAVIGFPILFDTQPRPIAVDIPIDIPDRNAAKPLALPAAAAAAAASGTVATAPVAQPAAPAPATPSAVTAAPVEAARPAASAAQAGKVATAASLDAREQVVTDKPAAKTEAKADAKAEVKADAKAEARPAVKPEAKAEAPRAAADDGARAKALLEGKAVEVAAAAPASKAASKAAAVEGRFVVQFGAFSEKSKAQEARMKVERAGLKTYEHVAETKDGKRIRVRVGPFGNRADAEKAASKIKGLDLPANILTL